LITTASIDRLIYPPYSAEAQASQCCGATNSTFTTCCHRPSTSRHLHPHLQHNIDRVTHRRLTSLTRYLDTLIGSRIEDNADDRISLSPPRQPTRFGSRVSANHREKEPRYTPSQHATVSLETRNCDANSWITSAYHFNHHLRIYSWHWRNAFICRSVAPAASAE
jgi:hypothetical protein